MELRTAADDELPRLMALINDAYAPAESMFCIGPRITPDEMREKFRHGAFLVDPARGSDLRGVVHIAIDGTLGYFGPLAVRPDLQGIGLGRLLVDAAEHRCREAGCSAVEIDVVNHRRPLLDFYARRGYVVTGQRPFPEADAKLPTHFVVMRKSLVQISAESPNRRGPQASAYRRRAAIAPES